MTIREEITQILAPFAEGTAFSVVFGDGKEQGEYASNLALVRGKTERKNPKEVAEDIKKNIEGENIFNSVEVAGPGFLNFVINPSELLKHACVLEGAKAKEPKNVSIEFVSANPTGPLHIGNVRGGPIGDLLARIFERQGHKVTREYLNNDAGAQITKFGASLWHWYLQECGEESTLEEVQYSGEYIKDLVKEAKKVLGDKLAENEEKGTAALLAFALEKSVAENFETLKAIGITYDKITSDSDLLQGDTQEVLKELEQKNLIIEKEDAKWFAPSSEFMPDPAVVVKGDGTPIYFANDIAYHKKKFAANDIVIDILGEGHHGHIPKLKAIAETYDFPLENFYVVVHGQVSLIKDGKPYTMSKRMGNFVAAQEVLDMVGVDALRYFFLSYDPRSGMKFDIDLAQERSKQNPVYYIQYAHARAERLFEKSEMKPGEIASEDIVEVHTKQLLLRIAEFEEVIEDTSRDFGVNRVAHYAYELARDFTSFYEHVRILDEVENTASRLGIVLLAQNALRDALDLMGISAPKEM